MERSLGVVGDIAKERAALGWGYSAFVGRESDPKKEFGNAKGIRPLGRS